jgi:hypothetical protein
MLKTPEDPSFPSIFCGKIFTANNRETAKKNILVVNVVLPSNSWMFELVI